jgi:hypothetical protein
VYKRNPMCGAFTVSSRVTDVLVFEFYPYQIKIYSKKVIFCQIFSSYVCYDSDCLS